MLTPRFASTVLKLLVAASGCSLTSCQRAHLNTNVTAVSATTTAATPTVAVVSGYSESPLPKRIDLGINLFEPGSEKFRVGAKATIATKAAELGSGTCVDVEAFQDRPALVNRRRPMEEITLARGYAVQAELEANRVVVRDVIVRKAVVHNGRAPSRRVELVVVQ